MRAKEIAQWGCVHVLYIGSQSLIPSVTWSPNTARWTEEGMKKRKKRKEEKEVKIGIAEIVKAETEKKPMCSYVHSSIIQNIQQVDRIQQPTAEQINKVWCAAVQMCS